MSVFVAGAASLTGKWQVHLSIGGTEIDQKCDFTQKGDDLSGTCVSDRGTVNIAGKVNGNKATWSYKSEYEGSPITANYEGTVGSGNKITGTVNVPEYSADGDFTATQAK